MSVVGLVNLFFFLLFLFPASSCSTSMFCKKNIVVITQKKRIQISIFFLRVRCVHSILIRRSKSFFSPGRKKNFLENKFFFSCQYLFLWKVIRVVLCAHAFLQTCVRVSGVSCQCQSVERLDCKFFFRGCLIISDNFWNMIR